MPAHTLVDVSSSRDPRRRGWHVTLGVAPGLTTASYAALDIDPEGRAYMLDSDVLMGNRAAQLERAHTEMSFANLADLMRRFKVHRMLIEVVCERHNPCVLAIGPAARAKEPHEHVQAARMALHAMGKFFGLPVLEVTKAALRETFAGTKLRPAIDERLVAPLSSSDRRILLATGSALVAATEVRNGFLLRSAG